MDIYALPLDTPALKPPLGLVSNFDNPSGIHGLFQAISIAFLVICTIFVWMKLYTRHFISKSLGWDDYTSFIAWMGFVGYITIALSQPAAGLHQWDVRLRDFVTLVKRVHIQEIYYCPLIFVTKLSILLQYLRIFVPFRQGKTYWSIHFLIWSNLLFYLAIMLCLIVQCRPIEKIWNPTVPGHCVNISALLISGSIINIISDISILVLPLRKIWQLQMSRKRKCGISAIFAAGLFACVASVIRLIYTVWFIRTHDDSFEIAPLALWVIAEIATGIVCGCLPSLPHFFHHYVPIIRTRLTASFRSKSQSRSSASDTPKGYRAHASPQAPVKRDYVELDDYVHSKDSMGVPEGGIYSQRTITIERSDLPTPTRR